MDDKQQVLKTIDDLRAELETAKSERDKAYWHFTRSARGQPVPRELTAKVEDLKEALAEAMRRQSALELLDLHYGDMVYCKNGEASFAIIQTEGVKCADGVRYYAYMYTEDGRYIGEFKLYQDQIKSLLVKIPERTMVWLSRVTNHMNPQKAKTVLTEDFRKSFPNLITRKDE